VSATRSSKSKNKTCVQLPTLDLQFIEAALEFAVDSDFRF